MAGADEKINTARKIEVLKLPYLVLATLILSTIGVTYLYYQSARSKDLTRFNNEVNRLQTALDNRLGLYVALLRSSRGFIESKQDLTREGFSNFVKSLELNKNYVGVEGIGYSRIIKLDERDTLTEKMLEEGFTNFRIFPDTDREPQNVVLYIEPYNERNRIAVGYDMYSESARREALQRSIDTGEAAATEKLVLLLETKNEMQFGFLIYLPIYQDGVIPEAVGERRENIKGFVYIPFRAGNFLKEIQQITDTEGIGVTIYDGEKNGENKMAQTLFENSPAYVPQIGEEFSDTRELTVAGRKWIIEYDSLPTFADQSSVSWAPIIFFTGTVFSFLLFGMTYWESSARAKLQAVAAELFDSEKQKRRLLVKEQEARRLAEKASRAKDEFISVVSHELRTPLNAIAGWTRILRTNNLPENKKEQALEKIERNLRHQIRLVDDLLSYSQMVSEKTEIDKQRVAFSDVFEEAIVNARTEAEEKGIKLYKDNKLNGETVYGDREKLKTVIDNLLSNAIKFTPEGGTINARLERKEDNIQMRIKDSGAGISSKFMPHIFDRFQQEDSSITRKHGGLGLGLAISKHIVTLHRGSIIAESEGIDRGAVFTVNLPCAEQREAVAQSFEPDR